MNNKRALSGYAKNIVSQFGEDGIIEELFNRIGTSQKICVEFGAWDGMHLSNTWNLWHNHEWSALLIEGHKDRFETLQSNVAAFNKVNAVNTYIALDGPTSLERVLDNYAVPKDFDLLSIDIDGDDYHVFKSITGFMPRVRFAHCFSSK